MLNNYALTEILNSAKLLERLTSRTDKTKNKLKRMMSRSSAHQFVVSNILSSCPDPLAIDNLTLTSLAKNAPCTRVTLHLVLKDLTNANFINKCPDPEDERKSYYLPKKSLINDWFSLVDFNSKLDQNNLKSRNKIININLFSRDEFLFHERALDFWKLDKKRALEKNLAVSRYNLVIQPDDTESWLMLSLCRRTLGRDFPPNRDYKRKMLGLSSRAAMKALKYSPVDPRTHANAATAYLHQRKSSKCLLHIEKAQSIGSLDRYTLSSLVYTSASNGNIDLSKTFIELLDKNFSKQNHLFLATIGLMLVAYHLNDKKLAIKSIKKSDINMPYNSIVIAFVAGQYNAPEILSQYKNMTKNLEPKFFDRSQVKSMLKSAMTKENADILLHGIDKSDWWNLA